MAAKESAEMKAALALVAGGMSVKAAAKQAGVYWTSVYQAIARYRAAEKKAAEAAAQSRSKKKK